MGRAPLNSPESVRAVVQQLLGEAGTGVLVTPPLFRRLVSSRRVRERLGGGDPAWLGRQIRAIEAEMISTSAARFAVAGIPESVAATMRSLWESALEAARIEFNAARVASDEAVALAVIERNNANALTAMHRAELDDWQQQASERDTRIGQLEAELAASQRQLAEERERMRTTEASFAEVSRARQDEREKHDKAVAAIQHEYAGLSRQLLAATDEQRQALLSARASIAPEVKALRQRLVQMNEECDHLKRTLASASPKIVNGSSPSATQNDSAD